MTPASCGILCILCIYVMFVYEVILQKTKQIKSQLLSLRNAWKFLFVYDKHCKIIISPCCLSDKTKMTNVLELWVNSDTLPAGEQSESLLCVRSGQTRTAAASLRVCLLKQDKEDMPENTEDSVCDPSPDTGLVKRRCQKCVSAADVC